jgi:hypothetical protein
MGERPAALAEVVPYITRWSAEHGPSEPVTIRDGRLAYEHERPWDRDRFGVLWMRAPLRRGKGRPEFGTLHPRRQRAAMTRLCCQVCGQPADHTSEGLLWLTGEDPNDQDSWPSPLHTADPRSAPPARSRRPTCAPGCAAATPPCASKTSAQSRYAAASTSPATPTPCPWPPPASALTTRASNGSWPGSSSSPWSSSPSPPSTPAHHPPSAPDNPCPRVFPAPAGKCLVGGPAVKGVRSLRSLPSLRDAASRHPGQPPHLPRNTRLCEKATTPHKPQPAPRIPARQRNAACKGHTPAIPQARYTYGTRCTRHLCTR